MTSPITPDLVYDLTTVSQPSISMDGARLAFVRSKVDRASMETCSQVMVMDLPEGEAVTFTSGPKDGGPRFSPDGGRIAFLREDDRGRRQVWLIAAAGGEARRLTDVAGGVQELAWSPDSKAIVVVSDVDPDRPPEGHDPKKDPRVRVVRRIRYRYDTVGWRGDAHRHLFAVDAASGETRQLTDGDWDDGAPAWSPDGRGIAFVSGRRGDRDTAARAEAWVVPAAGGDPARWSDGLENVVSAAWAPDGDRLVVLGSADPEVTGAWQGRLFIVAPGARPRQITDDSVSPIGGFPGIMPPPDLRWTDDGQVVFIGDSKGASFLYSVAVSSGAVTRVAGGGARFAGLTLDGGAPAPRRGVVVAATPASPGDLWLADFAGRTLRPLTDVNGDYLGTHPPGTMERFTIERAGAVIESRVILPPAFDPSKRYPVVLDIHGGPHGVFYDAFDPVQQVLATAGYVVLAVNPRGSFSYGVDFMKAVLRDWGGEDYLDIMAAVDELVARPYVDPSRLGVTGYSYGGFMSAWIVGHDTRFKAAVVGAPCINLSSMYGTSDIGVSFGEIQWGGTRAEALEAFLEHSPLTYAPSVETPVLLLHGEDDHRCPISQSEEYFVTLKRLGKEVEMVRFPGCAHSFLRTGHPKMRGEYLARMLAWFEARIGAGATGASRRQPTPAGR